MAATSCRNKSEWRVAEGVVWHTTYRIVYLSPTNLDDSIREVMNRVEMSLSPFNPLSLISRINRGETDHADNMVDSVINISRQINRQSNGRFDPTVSPLVNLWGFGYDHAARERAQTDTAAEAFNVPQDLIDSALHLVGISECRVTNGRVIKKHPATTFNFSAVTKGFACDEVARMLRRNNANDHMVEIGGEIAVGGLNRAGTPWHIQIDAPISSDPSRHKALKLISLTDCGIATSGNYRNFHDTRRYGRVAHIISPLTGRPVQTDVISATVIAPSAAIADAWATACMASQADSVLNTISTLPGIECLLVANKGDSLVLIASKGFPL